MTDSTEPAKRTELHAATRAIRAGRGGDGTSLAPVLWPTTTFVTPTVDVARKMATSVGAERMALA